MAGYYGLIRLQDEPGLDQVEWSRRLLDTLFHDFPADNSDAILETCRGKDGVDFRHLYAPFNLPASEAAGKMNAAGGYPPYLESIIKSAEKSRNLCVLLRWPPLTADLVYLGHQPYTVPWANRVLSLIAAADVKKLSRVDSQGLAALRKNVTYYRDQCLPLVYTPPSLGPWAEYVFKPSPLKGPPQDNGKVLGVEMIALDRQAEAEKTPEPLVMVWCRNMPQRPGDRRSRCVVTRVGIAGGALHEIARFISQTNVIKAIALGDNTIFLAFQNQGLTVVRSKGVERYDEARGARRRHRRHGLAGRRRLYGVLGGHCPIRPRRQKVHDGRLLQGRQGKLSARRRHVLSRPQHPYRPRATLSLVVDWGPKTFGAVEIRAASGKVRERFPQDRRGAFLERRPDFLPPPGKGFQLAPLLSRPHNAGAHRSARVQRLAWGLQNPSHLERHGRSPYLLWRRHDRGRQKVPLAEV